MVLKDSDFPLQTFFCCKKGLVYLQKIVTLEKVNFLPIDKDHYEKKFVAKKFAHTLGEVKPTQYFGVEESLMNMHAGQLPCTLAVAAEDTILVFFDKHDFVDVFSQELLPAETSPKSVRKIRPVANRSRWL